MRRQKQRGKKQYGPAVFLAAALMLAPVSLALIRSMPENLLRLGEQVAFASALSAMPDSGLELLASRFRDELANFEDDRQENAPIAPPDASYPVQEPDREEEEPQGSESSLSKPGASLPKIPKNYQRALLEENFSVSDETAFIRWGNGFLRNSTNQDRETVEDLMDAPFTIEFERTEEPQVLILHTHATESYEFYDRNIYDNRNTWRSTDNTQNVVMVGNAIEEELLSAGIGVIHDTTQHDYPSYNGSYERSAKTIKKYLEEYPSIKVVLDIHRDAIERDNETIVKPAAVIDGVKAAQVMIIAGCDDGTMDMPDWPQNLKFAALLQDRMETYYPGLTRPIMFSYRKYNMDLTTGSLLLEFGSNANTLDEAVYSGRLVGRSLASLILEYTE